MSLRKLISGALGDTQLRARVAGRAEGAGLLDGDALALAHVTALACVGTVNRRVARGQRVGCAGRKVSARGRQPRARLVGPTLAHVVFHSAFRTARAVGISGAGPAAELGIQRRVGDTVVAGPAALAIAVAAAAESLQRLAGTNGRVTERRGRALCVALAPGDFGDAQARVVVAIARGRIHISDFAALIRQANTLTANGVAAERPALRIDAAGTADEIDGPPIDSRHRWARGRAPQQPEGQCTDGNGAKHRRSRVAQRLRRDQRRWVRRAPPRRRRRPSTGSCHPRTPCCSWSGACA